MGRPSVSFKLNKMLSYFSKTTPPVKKYTGHHGDLSPEMEETLAKLKEWIQCEELTEDNQMWDDYYLLRFCRARNFQLPKVQEMFKTHMEWRREKKVSTIIQDFHYEERDAFQKVFPHGYH